MPLIVGVREHHWHQWQWCMESLFIVKKRLLVMIRTYKFRLYPSRKQQELLVQHSDLARWLWNELLAETKKHYQLFSYFLSKQALQLMCKRYGLYSQTAQAVAHKVFNSVLCYLKFKKQGVKCGFPRFKSKHKGTQSIHYPQSGFEFINENKLRITPFGNLTIKKHRRIEGEMKTLTVKRTPTGKWFVTIVSELPDPLPVPLIQKAVGVDLGLEKLATLSTGIIIPNPRHLKTLEQRLKIQQCKLSKKVKRSKNYVKQSKRVAVVHERVSNARHDYLHKATNYLVKNYSYIALEDLRVKNMQQNHHLANSISDASWSTFTSYLEYKAESASTTIKFVNPRNTSQKCNGCSAIIRKSLSQRVHKCSCGIECDRDLNSAINILNKATAGHAGSNALRNDSAEPSMMREALFI